MDHLNILKQQLSTTKFDYFIDMLSTLFPQLWKPKHVIICTVLSTDHWPLSCPQPHPKAMGDGVVKVSPDSQAQSLYEGVWSQDIPALIGCWHLVGRCARSECAAPGPWKRNKTFKNTKNLVIAHINILLNVVKNVSTTFKNKTQKLVN